MLKIKSNSKDSKKGIYYINPSKINYIFRMNDEINSKITINIFLDNSIPNEYGHLSFEYFYYHKNLNKNETDLANELWNQLINLDFKSTDKVKLLNWDL